MFIVSKISKFIQILRPNYLNRNSMVSLRGVAAGLRSEFVKESEDMLVPPYLGICFQKGEYAECLHPLAKDTAFNVK